MRLDRRSRVDHRNLVLTDEIGVGAGSRHRAGVGRGDARHQPVEALRDAGLDDEAGGAFFFRIAPVDLEVGRIGAPEQALRALVVEGPAGGVHLDVAEAARVLQHVARRAKGGEVAQRAARRENQLDLLALVPLERLARAHPDAVHGFRAVVRALLARRRAGDEEARAEAARPARRGDPVAVVGDFLRVDEKPFAFQEFAEGQGARVQGFSRGFQFFSPRGIDGKALLVESQQDARLFEALARRGDPVGEAARSEAQARARLRVVEAAHASRRAFAGVVRIERATGKHVGAGQEHCARSPLEHEHLGRASGLPQQQDGCRRARHLLLYAQALRPARSFSFCALIIARAFSQSASVSLSRPVKPAPLAR